MDTSYKHTPGQPYLNLPAQTSGSTSGKAPDRTNTTSPGAADEKRGRLQPEDSSQRAQVERHRRGSSLQKLGIAEAAAGSMDRKQMELILFGPHLVGGVDSSDGGIYAMRSMMQEANKDPDAPPIRYVLLLDHKNAPYGKLSHSQLAGKVEDSMDAAMRLKLDALAAFCNTLCSGIKQGPEDEVGYNIQGREPAMLDLVDNSATYIAKTGGQRPVVFATEAMTNSHVYRDKIMAKAQELGIPIDYVREIAGGDKERFDGHDLATQINKRMHIGTRSEQRQVEHYSQKWMAPMSPEDTSLNSCCTHYWAAFNILNDNLEESGMKHIPFNNPMVAQWQALRSKLKTMENVDRSDRYISTDPVIITTGNVEDVKASVDAIMPGIKVSIVGVDDLKNISLDDDRIKSLLMKQPTSSSVVVSRSGLSDQARTSQDDLSRPSTDLLLHGIHQGEVSHEDAIMTDVESGGSDEERRGDPMEASTATLRAPQTPARSTTTAANDPGSASSTDSNLSIGERIRARRQQQG